MADMVHIGIDEAQALCEEAAMASGASEEAARGLASAAVAAEAEGHSLMGLSHFVSYLDALRSGRLDGAAEPVVTRPALALYLADAMAGSAYTAFDRSFDDFAKAARLFGVAVFAQKNAYTSGALGYFAARLAEAGLVSIAATNGPALLAGSGSTKPVYCTNPLAFAAPVADGPPLVIDQSSSATAFASIRKAAREGHEIPEGWAVDAEGYVTTDPAEAMNGALLAFGGERGANIALMVEVLAAGISGANWSLDAPSFASGSQNPGTGLFVLALDPKLFDPGFESHMRDQVERLQTDYGVYVPGQGKASMRERAAASGLAVERAVHDRIAEAAGRT
ncbi:MAG: Ldh family oxidoreductase [Alphaproteobacteria bacterium]|nr:Ldh family oxidoreductase [Alphaproteobacteria bacterium]MBU0804359.1 Ldh family oxidoreductase [Alphaproteobacteria bacterium]MBU0871190.1 Ldh family oxidoreductase [Alphaproteobacteria bacterium]MBU1400945.1 Ldh family oxidoreductase [Alphaproteobacteria bacterium]MBU1592638.1 Ldh family oxidoreductase [Alphaproteobacteria bacterium]